MPAEPDIESAGAVDLHAAARHVLDRLGQLASELDPVQRAVLGALVAPGIAEAFRGDLDADVAAFGLVQWEPEVLPQMLADAVARRRLDLRFE